MTDSLENSGKKKIRRHQRWVNSPIQIRLAAEIFVHAVLFLILLILVLYVDPFATMFSGYSLDEHQDTIETVLEMALQSWPFMLGCIGVLFLSTVFLSHRIAGPYFRLSRLLNQYAQGDFSVPAGLRPQDYLHGLVPTINQIRDRLQGDLSEIRSNAEKSLESLKATGSEDRDLSEALKNIVNKTDSYQFSKKEE